MNAFLGALYNGLPPSDSYRGLSSAARQWKLRWRVPVDRENEPTVVAHQPMTVDVCSDCREQMAAR